MACGDGNPVLRNSIRWPVSRTAYERSLKTLMVHSWSDGTVESTDSWMEEPKRIHCGALRADFGQ